MALLKIANLKKSYNITKTQKQNVLKGIDIEFKSGDLVAILGESGCGKSTLINILGGLDTDYTGSVVIKGDYIRDFSEKQMDDYRKKRVGLIFQNYNLIGHYTILENVELAMTIADIDKKVRKERALDLLKMVGLGNYPDKYPNQLSGGQKQRVAIARALANNPTIILADEPTGALDKNSAEIVMNILKKIAESGKLVLIVTHSQKVADECGRVVTIDDGKVVSDVVTKKLKVDSKRDKEIVPKNIKTKDIFKLAWSNIRQSRSRSLLVSIGMSIGIAAMILILCLSTGLTKYVNNIYGSTYGTLQMEVSKSSYSTMSSSDTSVISELDGVEADSVVLSSMLTGASYSYTSTTTNNEGEEETTSRTGTVTRILPLATSGDYDYAPTLLLGSLPESAGEIYVNSTMASALSRNDTYSLIGTSLTITYDDADYTYTIVGIYEDNSDYSSYSNVYLFESDIETIAGEELNNIIYLTLSDTTYIDAVSSDLQTLGYTVLQDSSSVDMVLNYIDIGADVLTVVGGISLVVSAIMIFIVLHISVNERIKEIGILRAVGTRKKDIRKIFIFEAGILGVMGGIFACAIALVLSLVTNLVCMVAISYSIISYNILFYLLGFVLIVIISILAGVSPSMRASDLDPVECLRAE